VDPLCGAAASVGSGLLGSGAGDVLSAVSTWVVNGAGWLLGQVGSALGSTTSVDIGAAWFGTHYQVMAGLAGVVVLPMLLCAVVQSIYRQSAAVLLRSVLVQLPLALLLTGAAIQLVQLCLAATDAMGSTVAAGAGANIGAAMSGLAATLVNQTAAGQQVPAFVVLLGGLLVAFGAFLLWVELLVRAAAVYVAVLFLPLALASLVWPAVSHWCRRLVDTLVALVLSKFVIVAILSLAVGALGSGTQDGFAGVLGGGALLVLAAFTPFTLLRLIPAVESGAVQQLEGARHRVSQAFGNAPRSAAAFALKSARSSSLVAGEPGTGSGTEFEAPGPDGPGASALPRSNDQGAPAGRTTSSAAVGAATARGRASGGGTNAEGLEDVTPGVPMWRGEPASNEAFALSMAASHSSGSDEQSEGRGPMPLWRGDAPDNAPGGGIDDGPPERPAVGSSPSHDLRRDYVIGRDDLGPVLHVPGRRSSEHPSPLGHRTENGLGG